MLHNSHFFQQVINWLYTKPTCQNNLLVTTHLFRPAGYVCFILLLYFNKGEYLIKAILYFLNKVISDIQYSDIWKFLILFPIDPECLLDWINPCKDSYLHRYWLFGFPGYSYQKGMQHSIHHLIFLVIDGCVTRLWILQKSLENLRSNYSYQKCKWYSYCTTSLDTQCLAFWISLILLLYSSSLIYMGPIYLSNIS